MQGEFAMSTLITDPASGAVLAALGSCLVAGALAVPAARRRRARRDRSRPARTRGPRRRQDRDPGVPVSVVVPALNEAESIGWVLARLPSFVSEVVLVDGLSTDRTEAVARAARPDLTVVHQYQPGKGAALRAGFAAATGDIVVMIDADGSTDPREMHRFVEALLDGADFVKGSRHLPEGGSDDSTLVRRTGNQVFVGLANALYGARFTDLCYGYCAFWRRHLDALALSSDGFEIETELVLGAVNAGLEVREVPSYELSRRAGISNLNAITDGHRVLRTLLLARRRQDPETPLQGAPLWLQRRQVPSPDSDAWLPAGRDRRRVERRRLDRAASGYTGPERRRADRRAQPAATRDVLVASALAAASVPAGRASEQGAPAIAGHAWARPKLSLVHHAQEPADRDRDPLAAQHEADRSERRSARRASQR
jgi:Glycosyl transferase family 2